MKLILIHRHFWPSDLPYSQMLADFALHASSHGFDVTVISPCESNSDLKKRESWASVNGIYTQSTVLPSSQGTSLRRKGLVHFKYLLWMSAQLLKSRGDLVWIATTPPVFAAAAVRWICRLKNTKYIYHCQDLHPEASHAIGKISNSFMYRLLQSIDRNNVNDALATVVLSEDMKNTLAHRDCNIDNVQIINNFVRNDLGPTDQPKVFNSTKTTSKKKVSKKSRWIFAGTMGHFQNLRIFVQSYLALDVVERPHLTFLGSGALKEDLLRLINDHGANDVIFVDTVDSISAQKMLAEYDVGVISLAPNVIKSAYPSKMANYLAAGLRIFAILEHNSDLSKLITETDVGYLGNPINQEILSKDIRKAAKRSTQEDDRNRSINVAREHFDATTVLNNYIKTARMG